MINRVIFVLYECYLDNVGFQPNTKHVFTVAFKPTATEDQIFSAFQDLVKDYLNISKRKYVKRYYDDEFIFDENLSKPDYEDVAIHSSFPYINFMDFEEEEDSSNESDTIKEGIEDNVEEIPEDQTLNQQSPSKNTSSPPQNTENHGNQNPRSSSNNDDANSSVQSVCWMILILMLIIILKTTLMDTILVKMKHINSMQMDMHAPGTNSSTFEADREVEDGQQLQATIRETNTVTGKPICDILLFNTSSISGLASKPDIQNVDHILLNVTTMSWSVKFSVEFEKFNGDPLRLHFTINVEQMATKDEIKNCMLDIIYRKMIEQQLKFKENDAANNVWSSSLKAFNPSTRIQLNLK
uniref:VASt domain-containing protein n=1 Tax=Panagrolaimus sp. ES5 TaxID=591445 RepID=A0AC34FF17_9BILA